MTSPILVDFTLPINTPRLLLRQPVIGYTDSDHYTQAVKESLPELKPWVAWAYYNPTILQSEAYVRRCCANWILKSDNDIGLTLWIIEKDTNAFIGNIQMWNIDWYTGKYEFGFWLRTSHTGKGYITEATNALARYCFLQQQAKRIVITCKPENIRSKMVPTRLNFNLAEELFEDLLFFSCDSIDNLPALDVTW